MKVQKPYSFGILADIWQYGHPTLDAAEKAEFYAGEIAELAREIGNLPVADAADYPTAENLYPPANS